LGSAPADTGSGTAQFMPDTVALDLAGRYAKQCGNGSIAFAFTPQPGDPFLFLCCHSAPPSGASSGDPAIRRNMQAFEGVPKEKGGQPKPTANGFLR
jgi:hypothetical protein